MLESGKALYWFLSPVLFTGFLLWSFLIKRSFLRESLFLIFILGITFFYSLVLLQVPLGLIVVYFQITAIVFPFGLAYLVYKRRQQFVDNHHYIFTSLFILILGLILVWPIVKFIIYDPIIAWDARSIWYFRAKQICFNNGFSKDIGLCSVGCPTSFSHSAYPILMPSIGAFMCKCAGYWNEYLPKNNLLVLICGMFFAFFSLRHLHVLVRLAIFFCLLAINPYMHLNGYLDSWLGVYVALTLVFLCEYIRIGQRSYFYTFLCSLIFICYIKNEGTFLSLCMITITILSLLAGKPRQYLRHTAIKIWKAKYLISFTAIPYLLWAYHKKHLDLHEIDYDFSVLTEPDLWKNFFLSDKYFMMHDFIVQKSDYIGLYCSCLVVIGLSLLTYKIQKFNRIEFRNAFLILCIPLLTCLLFYFGICIVYYSSLIDLEWHLATSADRLREHMVYMSLISFIYAISLVKVKMKFVFD